MQTHYKQQNVAHAGHQTNLLDDINLFPSKEEGRIPGGRGVRSENQAKRVSACVYMQGKLVVYLLYTDVTVRLMKSFWPQSRQTHTLSK